MSEYPQHFKGTVHWVHLHEELLSQGEAKVMRYFTRLDTAIVRSTSEIAVEFHFGGTIYTVALTRTDDGQFEGSFQARDGGTTSEGSVSARLFTDERGGLLFGNWINGPPTGPKETWWVELHKDDGSK